MIPGYVHRILILSLYSDINVMTSKIISNSTVCSNFCFNNQGTTKAPHNSPCVIGIQLEFFSQIASNAERQRASHVESASMLWRLHVPTWSAMFPYSNSALSTCTIPRFSQSWNYGSRCPLLQRMTVSATRTHRLFQNCHSSVTIDEILSYNVNKRSCLNDLQILWFTYHAATCWWYTSLRPSDAYMRR